MPVGAFVRMRLNDNFMPQKRDRYMYTIAYDWLD